MSARVEPAALVTVSLVAVLIGASEVDAAPNRTIVLLSAVVLVSVTEEDAVFVTDSLVAETLDSLTLALVIEL